MALVWHLHKGLRAALLWTLLPYRVKVRVLAHLNLYSEIFKEKLYCMYVQSQKIVSIIRSRFCQNVKGGVHLWGQPYGGLTFFGKFLCQEHGQNGFASKKKRSTFVMKNLEYGRYIL